MVNDICNMCDNSPNPSTIQSLPDESHKNSNLFVKCQHVNDKQGSSKLTGTHDGRNDVIDTSK